MGLTIDESAEAHNSTESIDRCNCPRKHAKRTAVIQVDRDIKKIDNDRNRGIVDQVPLAHTTERPVTRLLTAGRSRGRRVFDDSNGKQDDPTRTVLQKAIKSMLRTPD